MPEGSHLLEIPGLARLSRPHDKNQRRARGPCPRRRRVELQGDEIRQLDVHVVVAT
jgi:hypothetical protein